MFINIGIVPDFFVEPFVRETFHSRFPSVLILLPGKFSSSLSHDAP